MVKIITWMTKGITELKEYLLQVFFDKSQSFKVKILAIFLSTLGFLFITISIILRPLFSTNDIGTVGIILFFMGIFIFFFFPEKIIEGENPIESFVFFFLTGWLIFMTFIALGLNYIFFISVVFGILILKEFANGYLTPPLKKKLSMLAFVFFFLSLLLIVEKIINVFYYL